MSPSIVTPDFSLISQQTNDASETGTSPPALAMLKQAGLIPAPPTNVKLLDIACGVATVTVQLHKALGDTAMSEIDVVCGDIVESMVGAARQRLAARGLTYKAEVMDAQALPLEDAQFSHVLCNFGPQLIKDPMTALKEFYRVLAPSGTVGFTAWTHPGWSKHLTTVVPSFKAPPFHLRPWADLNTVKSFLTDIGFTDINANFYDFDTEEKHVEGYINLLKILLLPSKMLSDEDLEVYAKHLRDTGDTRMQWQCLVVTATKP